MNYQVTIRYGKRQQRYLSLAIQASDAAMALRQAADEIPDQVIGEVDIVELREAPDFEKALPPGEGA